MKRMVLLLVTMSLALLAAGGVVLVAMEESAKAAFPGENGRIAFGRNGDIFSMNPDGAGVERLTDTPAYDESPGWSPDGKKIAFSREDGRIYVMNADGSGERALTTEGYSAFSPAWSPSGNEIAFSAHSRGDTTAIFTINADGGEVKRVTLPRLECRYKPPGSQQSEMDRFPAWSPDGEKIAFQRRCSASDRGDIFTVNADGTQEKNLTDDEQVPFSSPDWSPNGKKIAYGGFRDFDDLYQEIYVVNRDGSGQSVIPGTLDTDSNHPVWSPEGDRIAFVQFPDGGLYSIKLDGSDRKQLTDNLVWESPAADWQPLPASEPQSKAECKNGGYKEFGFKNQGRCIAFVNRAAHTQ